MAKAFEGREGDNGLLIEQAKWAARSKVSW